MFLTLIRRELLANLLAFRFFVAMGICLLLIITNSIMLMKDYQDRLTSYNTAVKKHRDEALAAKTYSYLNMNVNRPPNPLSIFNQGMDKQLGNKVNSLSACCCR